MLDDIWRISANTSYLSVSWICVTQSESLSSSNVLRVAFIYDPESLLSWKKNRELRNRIVENWIIELVRLLRFTQNIKNVEKVQETVCRREREADSPKARIKRNKAWWNWSSFFFVNVETVESFYFVWWGHNHSHSQLSSPTHLELCIFFLFVNLWD